MKIRILAIAIILSLSMVLSGCGLITRFLPEDLEGFLEDIFSKLDDYDINGNDETYVNDETYANDETTGQGDRAPTSDSEGKDIDNVPRYPGSVRIQYTEYNNAAWVTYIAQGAELEDIRDFYVEKLEDNNWNIVINLLQAGDGVVIQANSEGSNMSLNAQPSSQYDDSIEIIIMVEE